MFANQKVLEAVDEVVKYQDLFDFDLRELFGNLKLYEPELQFQHAKMYDWIKNEYVENPQYEPNSDWEYSDEDEEDDEDSD